MRSGSPANDGSGWPSAQRPDSNEALGNQGRHASGARSEPQDTQGAGRRDVPFGPEVSWPYGFRQLDPESREVLESAYGSSPVYQQSAMDDYGYGDPGYSDPSYEGPKTPYGNPAFPAGSQEWPGNAGAQGLRGNRLPAPVAGVPGYQVPEVRDPSPPAHQGSGYQASGYAAPGRQPHRSRRRPAAAMRSGRSPGQGAQPRTGGPPGGPGPGKRRVPGAVVRQPAAGRPGPRRLEPVAVSRPAARGHDLRRAALRGPGTG